MPQLPPHDVDSTPPHVEEEASPSAFEKTDLEPLTVSLLGRFFGVPLLIIGSIVGCACLVVVLFGGPATQPRRNIEELLQALEGNTGQKSLGILLPREKELWQTAFELSQRLQQKDSELTSEELKKTAERLTAMIRIDMLTLENIPTVGMERVNQLELRSGRLLFLIRALGRTGLADAVEPLAAIVRSGVEPFAGAAIGELGNLAELPEARANAPLVARSLLEARRVETQLLACTALSVLADPHDREAIEALRKTLVVQDGEVAWSAALALARLGDPAGKSTLMDMLERSFWQSGDRFEARDEAGNLQRYPMPAARVDQYLVASISAASRLGDADLWAMIERLQSDSSLAVKAAAAEAIQRQEARN